MKLYRNIEAPIYTAAIILLLFSGRADAYIDPGSGSYMLQLIAASFFAVLFALKIFWRNIKVFFARVFSKGPENMNGEKRD